MGTRRGQKPSHFLVVAGVSRGVILPRVSEIRYLLFGKPIHVTILFVSNRHCNSLWLGYDPFRLCHSVIPYGYVC